MHNLGIVFFRRKGTEGKCVQNLARFATSFILKISETKRKNWKDQK